MKIAIIGAGFTGIAAAWDLIQAGHQVSIFEAAAEAGGLASGFSQPNWQWSLERHYHHIFSSDRAMRQILKDMKLEHLLFFRAVKTSVWAHQQIAQLDSPLALLRYPFLSWRDRCRMGAVLAFCKVIPDGTFLDRWTAHDFLRFSMGDSAYQHVWRPLLVGKFGQFAEQVNAAWFWARVKARTPKLGYFKGGFGYLANQMVKQLTDRGADVHLASPVSEIKKTGQRFEIKSPKRTYANFDRVLVTGVASTLCRLVPSLPSTYQSKIAHLDLLGAATLVLELSEPVLADHTYWLSITDNTWPLLAVVEHTNLVEPARYAGRHLMYVARYLPASHPAFAYSAEQLFKIYLPYLKQLSPNIRRAVKAMHLFKDKAAQPVVRAGHAQDVPSISTPVPGLFWAGMQHVYPWDRGTNFAVGIGRTAAGQVLKSI